MNRLTNATKLLLAVAITILIVSTVLSSRDYQDSWVLEGLEIPFVFFVITYVAAFFSEKKTRWMITLAIVGRFVFLIIPNLKYVWFQGTAIDQQRQYALANNVISSGHISTISTFAEPYISSPLMHISFSTFSLVLNVPLADSMKYLPVLWSPIIPLLTFIIVEKFDFLKGKSVLKYALFFSSIPFTMEQYIVTGTLLGGILAFFALTSLALILKKHDRRYWVVYVIFILAIVAAHTVTSIVLSTALLVILLVQNFPYLRLNSRLRVTGVLTLVLLSLAWLVFRAGTTLQDITHLIFLDLASGATPASEQISASFFVHLQRNPISAMRSASVLLGADALFLLVALVSLVIMMRPEKKLNDVEKFTGLLGGVFLFLFLVGAISKLGGPRALNFERLLFPVFSGILFSR